MDVWLRFHQQPHFRFVHCLFVLCCFLSWFVCPFFGGWERSRKWGRHANLNVCVLKCMYTFSFLVLCLVTEKKNWKMRENKVFRFYRLFFFNCIFDSISIITSISNLAHCLFALCLLPEKTVVNERKKSWTICFILFLLEIFFLSIIFLFFNMHFW